MKAWTKTRLAACPCPFCGYELDAASGERRSPIPGDCSVCINCAQPLIFTLDLTVRALSPAEFAELDFDLKTKLRRWMRAVRQLDRSTLK